MDQSTILSFSKLTNPKSGKEDTSETKTKPNKQNTHKLLKRDWNFRLNNTPPRPHALSLWRVFSLCTCCKCVFPHP